MSIIENLLVEFQEDAKSTRKMLERVPESSFNWKPHEKSMPLGRLATHIAEMYEWMVFVIKDDEIDFSKTDYKPVIASSSAELLKIFDENYEKGVEALKNAKDEILINNWKLRSGDTIYFDLPKAVVIRSMVMNHIIHHRGQLSVFLRLLNVPVPSVYGPTADEQM